MALAVLTTGLYILIASLAYSNSNLNDNGGDNDSNNNNNLASLLNWPSTHIFYLFALETAGSVHRHWADTRDWQAHHRHHRRHQRNNSSSNVYDLWQTDG